MFDTNPHVIDYENGSILFPVIFNFFLKIKLFQGVISGCIRANFDASWKWTVWES